MERSSTPNLFNSLRPALTLFLDISHASTMVFCVLSSIWPVFIPRPAHMSKISLLPALNKTAAVIAVAPDCAEYVLSSLRVLAPNCTAIGKVTEDHPGIVGLKTEIGGIRVVDMLAGEMVPRIC